MVKAIEELKEYIKADNSWYHPTSWKAKLIDRISSNNDLKLKKFLLFLRKSEYHLNNSKGSHYHTYLYWYYEGKKNRLGRKLGIEIYPNCFGKGLSIWHAGGIVVNPAVKAGENCTLHGGNCIGNKGSINVNPVLGDNVDIGYGAAIVGDVYVADNTVIGANAVVVKSINEAGKTVVGIPARENRKPSSFAME